MTIFIYDKTFEGLLTCIFDAYTRKCFPDLLQTEQEPLPLFYDESWVVYTDEVKAGRVWRGLQKKLSGRAVAELAVCWFSELPGVDMLLFRYMRKALDLAQSPETNFGDPDVLELHKIGRKVSKERERVVQFLRFQKALDGTYFAAIEPIYNVLPLALAHMKDRFKDQQWLIYDTRRRYGYFYNLSEITEVCPETDHELFSSGLLDKGIMDRDEQLFQQLWQTYFKATTIRERTNLKLHRQQMPVRFWKYLTEKQV
ncbi:MAG: TIGR03915 family putative DNA repair protein [Coprobacter sp.]|nr:TIGR03915 family putative DNA repair protein [Coprobacter sp.]